MKKRLEVAGGGLLPLAIGIVIVTCAGGCGKRGNPLPPLRPVPTAVTALTARRTGDRVEVRFTIPTDNVDRSNPPSVRRVDIYGAVGPTSATPPLPAVIPPVAISLPIASVPLSLSQFPVVTLGQPPAVRRAGRPVPGPPVTAAAILNPKFLRGHVDVRPPPPPAPPPPKSKEPNGKEPKEEKPPPPPPPPKPPDPRPAAGDAVTHVDQVTTEIAAAENERGPRSIRYVVVPVAGTNRNGAPSLVEVPLSADPPPPTSPALTYDETSMKMTWTPAAAGQKFEVYKSDSAGTETGPALNPAPLAVPEFTAPVEFGVERCFQVRAAVVMKTATVESAPAGPVCKTPVDSFPPAPPANLSLLPSDGKILVQWDAVSAADLAGYVVLRAEGGSTTFQPLMQTPIAETNYTDATTQVGTRYTYAVIAVDKAGNKSAPSNTADGVGR